MKNDVLPNKLVMFNWKVILVVSPKHFTPLITYKTIPGNDRYTLHTKINTLTISNHLQSKAFIQTKWMAQDHDLYEEICIHKLHVT